MLKMDLEICDKKNDFNIFFKLRAKKFLNGIFLIHHPHFIIVWFRRFIKGGTSNQWF